jgi:superfamily II DNA or RNA helicase
VLPTGTGKTRTFAELVRRCVEGGKRALVLAHRSELLDQAQRALASCGVRAAVEQGARRAGSAPVVVASVQTLHAKRLAMFEPSTFGLVVVDEAHHATAASYRGVLAHFAGAKLLGVTATPDRGDGVGLRAVFDSVAYRYELRAAIAEKHLAPLRARRITVGGIDLRAVRAHHGDLDQRDLAAVMRNERALHGIVVPLLEQASDRRTIVFGVDVAHAHDLADLINRYDPGAARAVDGRMDDHDRRALLAGFARGEFRILCNCALLTEGFDEPSIACVAIARPTKSRGLYSQMIGRGTRLAPGKADCLLLDFVGQAGKHRLTGPADCLAGADLDDAMREVVDRQLEGEQLELEDVLADAEREAKRRAHGANVRAKAAYEAREVDPFLAGYLPPPIAEFEREPATEAQLNVLRTHDMALSPTMTRADAERYRVALVERKRLGLASLKQCRALKKAGLDTTTMTMARANVLIGKLAQAGWKPWAVAFEPEAGRKAR